jgi:hypothetical protein
MMNKQINELRTKIDNIKEETSQDMENLRKKNKIELQNKTEGLPQTLIYLDYKCVPPCLALNNVFLKINYVKSGIKRMI